jgi:hypothetical protein
VQVRKSQCVSRWRPPAIVLHSGRVIVLPFTRILDADRSRWISLSADRLRQFGFAFDRF